MLQIGYVELLYDNTSVHVYTSVSVYMYHAFEYETTHLVNAENIALEKTLHVTTQFPKVIFTNKRTSLSSTPYSFCIFLR